MYQKKPNIDIAVASLGGVALVALMAAPTILAQQKAAMAFSYVVLSVLTARLIAPLYQLCAGYLLIYALMRAGHFSYVLSKQAQRIFIFLCSVAFIWQCVYLLQSFFINNYSIRWFFLHSEPYFQHLGVPFFIGALLFLLIHASQKSKSLEETS